MLYPPFSRLSARNSVGNASNASTYKCVLRSLLYSCTTVDVGKRTSPIFFCSCPEENARDAAPKPPTYLLTKALAICAEKYLAATHLFISHDRPSSLCNNRYYCDQTIACACSRYFFPLCIQAGALRGQFPTALKITAMGRCERTRSRRVQ